MAEQTIIVTGSKGGAGTTTVALNVATQIAQLTKKRTALLELARPFGQIALMLDIEPRFTLLDALDRGARLDAAVLASLMTRHKIGVDMLLGAAPGVDGGAAAAGDDRWTFAYFGDGAGGLRLCDCGFRVCERGGMGAGVASGGDFVVGVGA